MATKRVRGPGARARKEAGGFVAGMRAGLQENKIVIDSARAKSLLSRLPSEHRKFAQLKGGVHFRDAKDLAREWRKLGGDPLSPSDLSGFYHTASQKLFLGKKAQSYTRNVGYTKRPSWRPVAASSIQRNGRVGASSTYYHEYAHAIDQGRKLANTRAWKRVSRAEWKEAWWKRSTKTDESWAEAYAMFARSKVSRARLKRERPYSHKYMKKFFDAPNKDPKVFVVDDLTLVVAGAAAGGYLASGR